MEVHRRRYELKDNALEFFLSNGKTVFLSFTKPKVNERGLSLWQQIYVLPWRQLLAVMNIAILLLFSSSPASGGRILYLSSLLPPHGGAALPLQVRNAIHAEILKLCLPNLMDSGEGDSAKLKMIVARSVSDV